jgi:hypothetical protein
MKYTTVLGLFLLSMAIHTVAQTSTTVEKQELYDRLAGLDSSLFSTVYKCNPERNITFFTEDLEFYHDKGGVTRSRKFFMEGLEKNFCGEQNQTLRRELIPGSLKVFKINNYGAIQMGEHRFYVTRKGEAEQLTGEAKFVHVWKQDNGSWKISRVLSYDHRDAGSKMSTTTKELYDTIAHMDTVLFAAFNAHDLKNLQTAFTNDLEFYHDRDGLGDYTQTGQGFRKMFEQNNGITRQLVNGSLEVYPINNYGAIEIGSHRFCHVENGKNDCGTFPFIMIWERRADGWKVSRVISYNH